MLYQLFVGACNIRYIDISDRIFQHYGSSGDAFIVTSVFEKKLIRPLVFILLVYVYLLD
jgi:hypothetical protein